MPPRIGALVSPFFLWTLDAVRLNNFFDFFIDILERRAMGHLTGVRDTKIGVSSTSYIK